VEHKVDAVQYIGELCRYLLNTPVSEFESKANVSIAFGNGLRADVWRDFKQRFRIKNILEYYAATEGNATTYNTMNKEGAVGFIPLLVRKSYPLKIAKYDQVKEQYVRGPDGFCVEAGFGEPGEILGLIENSDPGRAFMGYSDKAATEKKIIRDAFAKGDSYFRSGDLVYMDKEGFVYFVDRIGDTFRWKGENVSTNEVSDVLARVPGVKEANVYGISLKGYDGRCGMVAMVVDQQFDFKKAYEQTHAVLPVYANPYFLRIMPEMDTTSTLKHKKVSLVAEGCDPSNIKDPIYFRDDKKKEYVLLNAQLYSNILDGTVKF